MNLNMEKRGLLGKWMMRNTSSIQVNYDIIDEKDLEEVMFIADCIHPISAYLFSHSPFHLGKSVGRRNLRNYIWENTDNTRCKSLLDHGIYNIDNLLNSYIGRMMKAPGIFRLDDNLDITESRLSLRDDLEKKWSSKILTSNDIQAALHQIFTNVRLKSFVEIRGAVKEPDNAAKNAPTKKAARYTFCLLYTSPSPRDLSTSRMPSSA